MRPVAAGRHAARRRSSIPAVSAHENSIPMALHGPQGKSLFSADLRASV